jgi:threonine aldolase
VKPFVDLRSDTVTQPSAAMRAAMAEAVVGDDVYGEDATVNALQAEAAALMGFEATLFVPSGTMGNLIAVQLHAPRGTEAIVEANGHIYNYELASMAALAGVLPRVVRGERGFPDPGEVERLCRKKTYYHAPVSLLLLENTHNHASGAVLPMERKAALLAAARTHGVPTHLDGARVHNAATALALPPAEVVAGFDSVLFCLSKGLGAPVGSLLCGTSAFIEKARVARKRLGGGMRQVGVLAAAGRVALRDNRARLTDDHARARRLAAAVAGIPGLRIDPAGVETNIVIADLDSPEAVAGWLSYLREEGILAGTLGPGRIRFVTHLDVDDAAIDRAIAALRRRPGYNPAGSSPPEEVP